MLWLGGDTSMGGRALPLMTTVIVCVAAAVSVTVSVTVSAGAPTGTVTSIESPLFVTFQTPSPGELL